jgi:hypothetical protein
LQLNEPEAEEQPGRPELELHPLAELGGPNFWATGELQDLQNLERPEDLGPQSFTVAAAVEAGDQPKLVIFADQVSGTDWLLGSYRGQLFPANSELYMNSIYWLTGLDQLIAASARVQEVARVGSMSQAVHRTIIWGLLLGMPGICLAAGLGVWLRRRD